jgi:hypothetical protein
MGNTIKKDTDDGKKEKNFMRILLYWYQFGPMVLPQHGNYHITVTVTVIVNEKISTA